jgi:hypothetical protein
MEYVADQYRIFDKSTHDKSTHEEYQYLNIVRNIIDNGTWKEGRNGKTKSILVIQCVSL